MKAAFFFAIGVAFIAAAPPAKAQFAATRALDKAINMNVSQALERIQVKLQFNQPPTPATLAEMDASGRHLVVAHKGGAFEVWNLEDGRLQGRGGASERPVTAAEFGPDGALILVRGGTVSTVVRAKSTREEPVGRIANSPILLLAPHPALTRMALLRADGTIEVLDYTADKVLNTVHADVGTPQSLAIDRSGNYAAVVGIDGKLTIWDLSTGLGVVSLNLNRAADAPPIIASSFGVSPDRLTLVAANGKVLMVKGNQLTTRDMCGGECSLQSASVVTGGEEITAITAAGEQMEWKSAQRGASDAKPLGLPSPLVVKAGMSASMIALPLADGTVQLQRLATRDAAAPLLLLTTPQGWMAMDTVGRFDGPPNAQDELKWVGANVAISLTDFVGQYYEPGLLRKWASGAKSYLTTPPPIVNGVATPPLAAVNASITQGKSGRKNLRVAIDAEDRGGGLGAVYLYHQGVLISDRRLVVDQKSTADKRNRRHLEYEVQAAAGINTFGVTAENAEGILSPLLEQSVTVDQRVEKPTLHVLVIGLNKYDVPRLNLDYARKDAEELAQTLKTRSAKVFDSVDVQSLYDEKVDRDNILKAFAELKASTSEDTVIIYFAGHGDVLENQFYYMTHNIKYPFKAADAKKNALSFAELSDMIADLEARKVILLLDTCKSGDALGNIDALERDQRAIGIFGGRLGIDLLAGTDKGQLAAELSSLGHGLFTYTLLEALSGKADTKPADGLVSVKELIDYSEQAVTDLSGKYAQSSQHPTAISRGYDFAVGKY